ncbi:MAG: aldo/keto reductase, partial [Chloroflexota bacterium]
MTTGGSAETLAKRPFGKTGLLVTPLCVGCAPLGNMPETFGYSVAEGDALATVRAALDSPINFIDTASMYGDGESERRVGVVLRERGGVPEGYVLATKADRDLQTNEFRGEQARRSVERSLRLLGRDSFQVLYLHDPEYSTWEQVTGPGGALEALLKYRDQGVIQHLGIAGGPIDVMMRFVELGVFEAVITHNRYNLLNRDAEPLLRMAHARGMAVVNAAPYGSGILSKGPDAYPRFMYEEAKPDTLERARRLQA